MKPILFNTEMVRAILAGRKTVTRRVVKQSVIDKFVLSQEGKVLGSFNVDHPQWGVYPTVDDAPYQPGDILYVRETFTKYQTVNYIRCHDGRAFSEVSDGQFAYKADGYESIDDLKDNIRLLSDCSFEAVEVWDDKWHPSIHMPKEAARIFLRVTDVRVERLQDITDDGVEKEGVPIFGRTEKELRCLQAFSRYRKVWDSTIKPKDRPLYGWDANPWVWVIEFEKITKEELL